MGAQNGRKAADLWIVTAIRLCLTEFEKPLRLMNESQAFWRKGGRMDKLLTEIQVSEALQVSLACLIAALPTGGNGYRFPVRSQKSAKLAVSA